MELKTKEAQELKLMEKNVANLKAYIKKHLPLMAFYFHQTHGFPVEMFAEMWKEQKMNLIEQSITLANFYESKK